MFVTLQASTGTVRTGNWFTEEAVAVGEELGIREGRLVLDTQPLRFIDKLDFIILMGPRRPSIYRTTNVSDTCQC